MRNLLPFIAALGLASTQPALVGAQSLPGPNVFYVSPSSVRSDVQDGRSWRTAWSDFNRIDWAQVEAGDVVFIDGGSRSMTYSSPLVLNKNGSAQKPIYIATSREAGHNGKVVVKSAGALPVGIYIGAQNILLQGQRWNAMQVTGYRCGINISAGAKNVRLSNIEVCNNGNIPLAPVADGGDSGIMLNSHIQNITLNQLVIHDNCAGRRGNAAGSTNVRALNHGMAGVHFNRCLIYNTFPSMGYPSDGIRIHGQEGAGASSIDLKDCIVGPGLKSGIFVQRLGSSKIAVNGALFLEPTVANIDVRNHDVVALARSSQVSISHATSFLIPKQLGKTCLGPFVGSIPKLSRSIFYGGKVDVRGAVGILGSSNYQYKTTGNTVFISPFQIDPRFVSDVTRVPSTSSAIMRLNFALRPGSPAKGSGANITSVRQLQSLNQP